MAYCRKCGKILAEGANHCTVCGAPAVQPSRQSDFDTGRIPNLSNYRQPAYPPRQFQEGYAPAPVQPPQKPKNQKKSGAVIALSILLCILILALLGIGGFLLWNHLHAEGNTADGGIHNIDEIDGLPEGSETVAPPEETQPLDLSRWEGNWYGWWIVTEGKGDMYLQEGAAFDVCATITLGDNAAGTLTMFDNQVGDERTQWDIALSFSQAEDGAGSLVSTGGSFLGVPVGEGDLSATDAEEPYSAYPDMICIHGTGKNCSYLVFLRPWGTQWEDVRTGDMAQMPYPDMLPVGYDSWYLPLILEGQEMPNAF